MLKKGADYRVGHRKHSGLPEYRHTAKYYGGRWTTPPRAQPGGACTAAAAARSA